MKSSNPSVVLIMNSMSSVITTCKIHGRLGMVDLAVQNLLTMFLGLVIAKKCATRFLGDTDDLFLEWYFSTLRQVGIWGHAMMRLNRVPLSDMHLVPIAW